MFRIRKIYDDTTAANRAAIRQVTEIMPRQFSRITREDIEKLPKQLHDPLKYRYRSILFVAEDAQYNVKGFALLQHASDLNFCLLELLSAAPGKTGSGVGSTLYESARDEALSLKTLGIFFEVSVDDAALCKDSQALKQRIARMRFYESYGARPIINNDYARPIRPGDDNLYYLVFDDVGRGKRPGRIVTRKVVRAILEREYGDLCTEEYIKTVADSFKDDPVVLREPRYIKGGVFPLAVPTAPALRPIALIVNEGHVIHHVRERGYIQAPVRLSSILKELHKTTLFSKIEALAFPEKFIKAVHDKDYVDYLRRACVGLPPGKSIYPEVFPVRNTSRPPKSMPLRAGYYCIDPFTPLNHNAYLAARGAVNCALTGCDAILAGHHFAYALVRPPGHHAESRAFGGFCYFNSSAIAANYLSDIGRVAVLDVDFHHGNGTQEIFYNRSDVFTLSIHGHPNYVYPHFSGFEDEIGSNYGEGYNVNYPLPEHITIERYQKTLARALKRVADYKPDFLIIALGLDTAKGDPTGSWPLQSGDFQRNGSMIGALGPPTLVVQEGGYKTRTLGINARHFFEGLWQGYQEKIGQVAAAAARRKSKP